MHVRRSTATVVHLLRTILWCFVDYVRVCLEHGGRGFQDLRGEWNVRVSVPWHRRVVAYVRFW